MAFADTLRAWRRANLLKQSSLAHKLGVTQASISRWECGIDLPSPAIAAQLRTLMARELALFDAERLFISNQAGLRALFDVDGWRFAGCSTGLKALWPEFCETIDTRYFDKLVNESRQVNEPEYVKDAISGSLAFISGISIRHLDVGLDVPIKHRWHMCFRRFGIYTLAEVVFEPCEIQEPEGINIVHRVDQPLV